MSFAGRSSIPRRRFRSRTSRPRGPGTSRAHRGADGTGAGRDALAELLRRPRYEVFPVEGIADEVVTHVPTEIKVAVTSSPTRGIEATLRLCEELASVRFHVAPHLAARLVRGAPHDLNDPLFHLLSPTLPASQEVDELVDKRGVAALNVQMPQPFSASAAGVADSLLSLSALPAPRQLVERGISVT